MGKVRLFITVKIGILDTSANQPPPRHNWTVLGSLIDHTEVYSKVPNCLDLDKSL